jgi:hypothetical protein
MLTTFVIVAVLSATVGVFFVKLLNIQEQDREEAYVREKLVDICGAYADMMSVGSSIGTITNADNYAMKVNYRHETGGVSLETGVVTKVSHIITRANKLDGVLDLGVYAFESGGLDLKLARPMRGDAALIPLTGDMVSCNITPLNGDFANMVIDDDGYATTDAALGYLEVMARYQAKNDEGEFETKTVTVGRVVRLWNRE